MSMSISAFRLGGITAPQTGDTSETRAKAKGDSAEASFLTEAKKTPAERIREQILKQMDMTEEDLAKLDDKARAAVEDEIKQKMLQMAQQNGKKEVGVIADITA